MTWLSFADKRPVARIDLGVRDTRYRAVVLHTAVSSSSSLYGWWSETEKPSTDGAHFYVAKDGNIEQYVDTDHYCAHAWDANHWTVGIETWDNLDPEHTAWTKAQIDSILRICEALDVPGKLLKSSPSNGVGYHQEFTSWNRNSHNCPGSVRVPQVYRIIDQLAGGGSFVSDLSKAEQQRILAVADGIAATFGNNLENLGRSLQFMHGMTEEYADAHPEDADKPFQLGKLAAQDLTKGATL